MAHKIALNFEDGITRIIDCEPGEFVTDAAFRQRVNIPMDCRDGVCGTCKCYCEQGNYDLEFYMDDSLTEDEAANRLVLTCQMTVDSDCVVNIPTSSTACKAEIDAVPGKVDAVERLSDTSFSLKIKTEKPVSFLPGQYVNISVPHTSESRSYSFASAPDSTESTFLIRNLSGGVMSSYLSDGFTIDDELTLAGPMGTFYLRPIERPQLWLAGGTGLAPFLSMLECIKPEQLGHPIKLFYAVNRTADLVELDRLEKLAAVIGKVEIITIVADKDENHARQGYVTDHLSRNDLYDGNVDVYLCGPPPMVDAVRKNFVDLDCTPANFYFEKFNPKEMKEEAA
mgnify:CR=1 FL=1